MAPGVRRTGRARVGRPGGRRPRPCPRWPGSSRMGWPGGRCRRRSRPGGRRGAGGGRRCRGARRRAMARVGGSSSRIPATSVRNPGVSSSAPASRIMAPSATSTVGIRPSAMARLNRRQAASPSRLASQAPATLTTSSSTSVGSSPMTSPTAISTASSASGTRMKAMARIGTMLPVCLRRAAIGWHTWRAGGAGWAAAAPVRRGRGKSGLHRAGCWPTASRGDPQDSATENRPPPRASRAARVKRCGKSAPAAG